jgi:Zn-dependent metalloprotease
MISGARSNAYGAKPEAAAQAFLQENIDLFLPGGADKAGPTGPEFKLVAVKSAMPGSPVVDFREEYQGLPVYAALITIMVDAEGCIRHVTSTADPRVTVSATPPRSFQSAHAAFLAGLPQPVEPFTAQESHLVIYPGPIPRLAYRVIYLKGEPAEPWEYLLSAETGEVLKSTRLVNSEAKRTMTGGARPASGAAAARFPSQRAAAQEGQTGGNSAGLQPAPADQADYGNSSEAKAKRRVQNHEDAR